MKAQAPSILTKQPLTPALSPRGGARGIFIVGCSLTFAFAWALPAGAVTLDELVGIALSNHPSLQAADARVASARGQAGQASSAWYPQVKASANYARTDNPPQAFFMSLNQRTASLQKDFNQPDDTDNLRLSASAGWLLFDGGQRSAMIRMAGLGTEAQRIARSITVNTLVHDVARSFYGALQARDAVEVTGTAERSLEESLRLARERFTAGAAVKSDVLNLDVKLAEAKQRHIQARNGFELAVAALNLQLGTDRLTTKELQDASATAPTSRTASLSFAARPELRAAGLMVRMKQQALDKARRASAPTVSAFGSMDWDSDVSSSFERSYLAGVAAEIEVFDGHRKAQGVAAAHADVEAAEAEEALARRQLALDLTQARLGFEDATARRELAHAGVVSAEEALRLTRERYRQGAADISELLNAETALAASRGNDSAVLYETAIALSNLDRAQGLLSARHDVRTKE